jgi:hypothetical protein
MTVRKSRLASRVATALAASLALPLVQIPAASAALVAQTLSSIVAVAGIWGASPTAASITSAPNCQAKPSPCGPFTGTPVSSLFDSIVALNIWNTGSVNLKGVSYVISTAGGNNPTVQLDACSQPWQVITFWLWYFPNCPGTQASVLRASPPGTYAVTVPAGVPAGPGDADYLLATVTGNASQITISTSVAPSQVTNTVTNN